MEYNVQDLFKEAFGITVEKSFQPDLGGGLAERPNLNYFGVTPVPDIEEAVELSFMGTPVIHPITLLGGNYKFYTKDGQIETKPMPDFRLPITAIVDFSREKVISTTRVNNGAGGTVKELFSFDDWNITIRGFCVLDLAQRQGHISAFMQEQELLLWENIVDSIGVSGKLFNVRNISNMVIRSIPVTALRGKPKIKPFVINALSDEPLELML